jgi:hypothetical protein
MDREEALDKLYSVTLNEFTATRNWLSKELGSAEIRTLKKPNVAAWTINQLVRAHPDEVEELFEVTGTLRNVQRHVLSGGRASELREAGEERAKVVARLTKLAEAILEASGRPATPSTLSAIRDSFIATASDDEGAERLRNGRLERELAPGAFVDVGGLTLVPEPEADSKADTADDASDGSAVLETRRVLGEAHASLKDARQALRDARREADALERDADEVERQAKAAREEADFSRRAADARKTDVDEAERAVKDADEAVRDAERNM